MARAQPEKPAPGWKEFAVKYRDLLIATVFALLWLACSCLPSWPHVFPQGKPVRLAGPDAYFHLRHTEAVLENYPVVERFDLMTNFPTGEIGLNQGGFDIAMATVVKLTGLAPVIVLAWVSPLLMVATGVWCYFWLSRVAGWRCGALFLLLFLLYPGAMNVMAALGQGDHHAAEVFLAVAVAWSLDRLLRPSTSWRLTPLAALPLVFFYLSWAGTALHLLMVGAVFYLAAWRPRDRCDDKPLALKGALYGLALLLSVGLVGWLLPWAVIWETSQHAFYVGSSLLAIGYPVLVALTRRSWRHRWLPMLLLPLVPLALALLVPATRAPILSLFEQRTAQVAEHAAVSLQFLGQMYGLTWVLALVALAKLWRRGVWWNAYVPIVYGGGLTLFWLQTRDFNYYPPVLVAAGAAYLVEGFLASGLGLALVTALLVAPPLVPGSGVQHPWMTRLHFRDTAIQTDGLDQATAWLKNTWGDLKADSPQAYGLVAPWDLGNLLAQAGKTPVGWSQTVSPELAGLVYSDDPDETYRRLQEKQRPFRYILLPARNLSEKFLGEIMATSLTLNDMLVPTRTVSWKGLDMGLMEFSPRAQSTLLYQLYWNSGQGLGHYRMVFESSTRSLHAIELLPETHQFQYFSFPLTERTQEIFKPLLDNPSQPMETSRGDLVDAKIGPEVRIFELVPGALLTGRARPGSQVRASIAIRNPLTGVEQRLAYAANTGADGRFAVRVPYATDQPTSTAPGTVQVEGPYRVEINDTPREFRVAEADVQAGRSLDLAP